MGSSHMTDQKRREEAALEYSEPIENYGSYRHFLAGAEYEAAHLKAEVDRLRADRDLWESACEGHFKTVERQRAALDYLKSNIHLVAVKSVAELILEKASALLEGGSE